MKSRTFFQLLIVSFCISLLIVISGCSDSLLNYNNEESLDGHRAQDITGSGDFSFTTLLQSTYSPIRTKKNVIITNGDDLFKLYNEIFGPNGEFDLPEINFDENMVIACFMGEQKSGGYGIEISDISKDNDHIEVSLNHIEPVPGQMVSEALTQPLHIVSTKKSHLPVTYSVQNQYGKTIKKLFFEVLYKGTFSNISFKGQCVIKDREKLSALFSEMGADGLRLPYNSSEGVPEIDFNKAMVIAVFRGEQKSKGRFIYIESVGQEGESIYVTIQNINDRNQEAPGTARPFCIIVLDRNDRKVTFKEVTIEIPKDKPTEPNNKNVYVHYTVSGGIAGFNRELTIYENQTVQYIDRRTNDHCIKETLTRNEIRKLSELLQTSGFFKLKNQYGKSGAVSDQMIRGITYITKDGKKTIYILDDTDDPQPEELHNLQLFLGEIIARIIRNNSQ